MKFVWGLGTIHTSPADADARSTDTQTMSEKFDLSPNKKKIIGTCSSAYYRISILVLPPDGLLGSFFGISIWRMPLFILALIFEGSISSGIGMLR
jgi:hypothetical protein